MKLPNLNFHYSIISILTRSIERNNVASQQSSTRKRSRSERQREALPLGGVFIIGIYAITFTSQDYQPNTAPFGSDLWHKLCQGTQPIVVVCIQRSKQRHQIPHFHAGFLSRRFVCNPVHLCKWPLHWSCSWTVALGCHRLVPRCRFAGRRGGLAFARAGFSVL